MKPCILGMFYLDSKASAIMWVMANKVEKTQLIHIINICTSYYATLKSPQNAHIYL